jgi:stress-induced-phosphoprotein 1
MRAPAWTRSPPEVFPASALAPDAAAADEARAHKEAGNALYVRKAWRDAVERYDASIRLDATQAAVFTNRAAARFALFSQTGEKTELLSALRDAEQSLELDPKWVKGHYRKGTCLARLGDFHEALRAFLDGQNFDPRNEQIADALRDVQTALKETPKDWEDAKTRGNECYRDGKYEDAVCWYTRGLDLLDYDDDDDRNVASESEGADPDDVFRRRVNNTSAVATLLANRAEARRQMSDVSACVADCDRALRHDPTHVKARVRRALANEYLERYARAAEDFSTVVRFDSSNRVAREGLRRVSAYVSREETTTDDRMT